MNSHWYVITGVPGSGKTLLIDRLAQMGYATVPEAARAIFDEETAQGRSLDEIRGEEHAWQEKILNRILDTETKLDPQALTFFDRGAHDGLAHLRYYGLEPQKYWQPLLEQEQPYRTVFMLAPNPEFEQDNMRTENNDFISKVPGMMTDVYTEAGMTPIHIPFLPPDERLALILSYLEPPHDKRR